MAIPLIKSYTALAASQGQWVDEGLAYPGNDAILRRLELMKSLSTGNGALPYTAGMNDSGAPLILQDMDATFTEVLLTNRDIIFQKLLPRIPVFALNYEYDKFLSFGDLDGSPFVPEGGVPIGSANQYERDTVTVRQLAVLGQITDTMSLVSNRGGTVVNAERQENYGRTLELMMKSEFAIQWSKASLKNRAGNIVGYDGLVQQMVSSPFASTNVINMRNTPLTASVLQDAAKTVRTVGILSDFANLQFVFTPDSRTYLSQTARTNPYFVMTEYRQGQQINLGSAVQGLTTDFGVIPIMDSLLVNHPNNGHPRSPTRNAVANPQSPAAPTTVTATPGAPSSGSVISQFQAGQTRQYFVSAKNEYGESRPLAVAVSTITAGQTVAFTITNVANASSYVIYAADLGESADQSGWIAEVPTSATSTTSYEDVNDWIPNTDTGWLLDNASDNLALAQLAPMFKEPLAKIDLSTRFVIVMFHVPVIKAPQRMTLFKNIQRISSY